MITKPFILWLLVVSGTGESMSSAEYGTRTACEDARAQATITFGRNNRGVIGFCTAKGDQ